MVDVKDSPARTLRTSSLKEGIISERIDSKGVFGVEWTPSFLPSKKETSTFSLKAKIRTGTGPLGLESFTFHSTVTTFHVSLQRSITPPLPISRGCEAYPRRCRALAQCSTP